MLTCHGGVHVAGTAKSNARQRVPGTEVYGGVLDWGLGLCPRGHHVGLRARLLSAWYYSYHPYYFLRIFFSYCPTHSILRIANTCFPTHGSRFVFSGFAQRSPMALRIAAAYITSRLSAYA
eukprot:1751815-Rhodomonas_salina.7